MLPPYTIHNPYIHKLPPPPHHQMYLQTDNRWIVKYLRLKDRIEILLVIFHDLIKRRKILVTENLATKEV